MTGREIARIHLQPVSMKGPIMGRVNFAERLLGVLLGLAISPRLELDRGLTDLAHLVVFSEHIFHEADDKPRHGAPPVHHQMWSVRPTVKPIRPSGMSRHDRTTEEGCS